MGAVGADARRRASAWYAVVVGDDEVGTAAVGFFVAGEGGFGDAVEELAGDVDAPAALAGGFEVFPALPADGGGGFDEDGEVDVCEQRVVQGVDALDDDEAGGGFRRRDVAFTDPAMGLERPRRDAGDAAGAERGEIGDQALVIGEAWVVAVFVGEGVVVGQVIVGAEDAGGEQLGEVGLAGADGAGDGDDGDAAGLDEVAHRERRLFKGDLTGLGAGRRHGEG